MINMILVQNLWDLTLSSLSEVEIAEQLYLINGDHNTINGGLLMEIAIVFRVYQKEDMLTWLTIDHSFQTRTKNGYIAQSGVTLPCGTSTYH